MFKITAGKGFLMQFDNGYSVSVQFGYDNYCSNRYDKEFDTNRWKECEAELGLKGSYTAELAIRNPNNEFVGKDLGIFTTDNVEGWASAKRVLEVLNLVAALP